MKPLLLSLILVPLFSAPLSTAADQNQTLRTIFLKS
jgi:hypothetical protein